MSTPLEEVIARSPDPHNGSGPFWAYGSAPLARLDAAGTLAASLPDTSTEVRPLCNTRLRLFQREPRSSWSMVFQNPEFDQREPCPLAVLPGGRILVSINPRIAPFRTEPDGSVVMWYCSPRLLEFDAARPGAYPLLHTPVWDEPWPFTDHSYRGIAADGERGEVLLLNIEGNLWNGPDTGRYHWCLLDAEGRTAANGRLTFPVRGCYPSVVLRGRRACVLAVSDVVESNAAWAAHKREALGLKWDYDFRRLFLVQSPDIGARGFGTPLLVDDADATAGYLRHLDMLIDEAGDLHLLYLKRNVWKTTIRDRFFPGLPLSITLCYARVRGEEVVERRDLAACREDAAGWAVDPAGPLGPWGRGEQLRTRDPLPLCAALHVSPGRSPRVVLSQAAVDPSAPGTGGMFVLGLDGTRRRAPVTTRLDLFQAASARNGSLVLPGAIDLVGASAASPDVMRYASIPLD
jgi:hypothetical protein